MAPPLSSPEPGQDWDPAPLWSPAEERALLNAARNRRPDRIEGWTLASVVSFKVLRSPRAMVATALQAVVLVAFVVMLRDLVSFSSWGQIWQVFRYPLWTVALLMLATIRTRAMPARKLLRYWLMGTMLVTSIVHYLAGPLADLFAGSDQTVMIVPWLEELAKVAPVAALLGTRRWSPVRLGLSDLVVIGFVLGYGFRFTEDALWDRARGGGFSGLWGWIVPDAVPVGGGHVVVGHATWTALAAVGLGLIVLHWRKPWLAAAGGVFFVVPILDHMRANDYTRTEPWLHNLLFDLRLVPLFFVVAVAVAVLVDRRTLMRMKAADHLLVDVELRPAPASSGRPGDPGVFAALVARLRYLRLRNSAWFKAAERPDPWPEHRCPRDVATLARIGRTGRRAGVLDGNRALDRAWAIDPVDPRRQRWIDTHGWTPYVVETTAEGAVAHSVEPAPGRPHARPQPASTMDANWWRDLAIAGGVVGGTSALLILTGDDHSQAMSALGTLDADRWGPAPSSPRWLTSLPDATNDLPGAAVAGGPASAGPGSDSGHDPDSDAPPSPDDRPEDCS